MKLLVDGVFSRRERPGINRIWASLLQHLVTYPDLEITMLDRGDCPVVSGIQAIEFPSYTGTSTAADSLLVDQFCCDLKIDVFTSTYYTTPVTVPSVLVVHDLTSEAGKRESTIRAAQETEIALSFASYYACISESTRSDLKRLYPAIHDDRVIVTYCGADREVFQLQSRQRVDEFRRRFGLGGPYYLFAGLRGAGEDTAPLLETAHSMREVGFEIVVVGGAPPNSLLPRIDWSDDELACAYSGAEALVYPSLGEGLGMPIVEAMACGCPVITAKSGMLGEIAGDAALLVSADDRSELRQAIESVRDQARRATLISRGLSRAALFEWDETARSFYSLLKRGYEERTNPAAQIFFQQWQRIRAIQAGVDVET
jgi:glycosyltransferase involved in cell wall biosynthesis